VPPPAVLDLVSRHKAVAFYDERAGIAEFEGRLPREEAEARAFARCVVEWLNRNPVRLAPLSVPGYQRMVASASEAAGFPFLVGGQAIVGTVTHGWRGSSEKAGPSS
jgi:hypothetical protein